MIFSRLRRLYKNLKTKYTTYNNYFQGSVEEITALNLKLLLIVSLAAFMLSGFFLIVTPCIIPAWNVTFHYYLLLPSTLTFIAFSSVYASKKEANPRTVSIACILFTIVLLAQLIIIDVYPSSGSSASFMPVILTVFPIIFIYKAHVIFLVTGTSTLVYCILNTSVKPAVISRSDIFNAFVGFLFSFVVYYIVMKLRIDDYISKQNYKHMSTIDSLTDLLNKGSSEHYIREYFEFWALDSECSLWIIDIDNFKTVNDKLGHDVGDKVLKSVGSILRRSFRNTDIVGRTGGDEFIVLMKNVANPELIRQKALQIHHAVNQLLPETPDVKSSCSIGISTCKAESPVYSDVFQQADDALYEAKVLGKGEYRIHEYKPALRKKDTRKFMLIADDDKISRTILSLLFAGDYEILEVPDGKEALAALSHYRENIAIMILDLNMPNINGYQVLQYRNARTFYSKIPAIVITSDEHSEKEVLTLGASDFLRKPIDPDIAKLRVHNIMKSISSHPINKL